MPSFEGTFPGGATAARARAALAVVMVGMLAACGSVGAGGERASSAGLTGEPRTQAPPPERTRPEPPLAGSRAPGYLQLTPSADTRVLYVSAAGDDQADGRSPLQPKRTLPSALAATRPGFPDWVLVRRGDTFELDRTLDVSRSGRSAEEPFVIASYGESPERPLLRSTTEVAVLVGPVAHGASLRHVVLFGLALEEARTAQQIGDGVSEAIRIVAPDGAAETASDVRIEDVLVRGYGVGLNVLGANTAAGVRDLVVRRSLVLDTHHPRNAIGMLFVHVAGLTLDEVVVDGVQRAPGSGISVFDHSVYIQTDCSDVTVRGSVFARAPDGVMQRAGGVLEDNLIVDVAIGALQGYVFGGAVPTPGGVTFSVQRNALLDLGDLSPELPRGVGMFLGNVRSGVVRDNVIARSRSSTPWGGWAFALMGETNEGNVGVLDLTIADNTIAGMPTTLRLAGTTFGTLRFERNVIAELLAPTPFVSADVALAMSFIGNRAVGPTTGWRVDARGPELPLARWVAADRAREAPLPAELVDPSRDVASYSASLGGAPSLEAFLVAVRGQSAASWRDELTGRAASAWIREGYRARE